MINDKRRPTASFAVTAVSLLTLAVLVGAMDANAVGSYNPTIAARYCNALAADFPESLAYNDPDLLGNPSCVDPNPIATNTAYNATYEFNVPAGNYVPGSTQFVMVSPDHYVAPDAGVANGSKVGGVLASATVGLLNGPCTASQTSEFILYESTTSATTTIDPLPDTTPNRYSNLVVDANSDGFGDSNSPFVASNPRFYLSVFDPDLDYSIGPNGPLAPIQPTARYTGMARVPAVTGDWQLLSVFVFAPGSLAPFWSDPENRPHPLARVGRAPSDAWVFFPILNDPTILNVGPATEFCSPFSIKTMLKGTTPGGQVRFRTPTTNGTRIIGTWSYSQRDADNDGVGNQLDTCPFAVNTGVDSDADGIDYICDTIFNISGQTCPANGTSQSDQDCDGYLNGQDNCPQVIYYVQLEDEQLRPYSSAAPNGGPRTDGIGDQCDTSPSVANGSFIEKHNFIAKCIENTDTDGDNDGYCYAQDVNDGNPGVRGYSLNRGADTDGVSANGGDRWGANDEYYIGTDLYDECGVNAWPADFDDSHLIDISDILALKPVFNGAVPPTSPRFDIVPSKLIDISDVLALQPLLNISCLP